MNNYSIIDFSMEVSIIYIGKFSLSRDHRSAGAKRVYNQAKYLKTKLDLLIITFSSFKSEISFNKNFYIPEKCELPFLIITLFYLFNIFFLLLKRRKKNGKNYLILETYIEFYSLAPFILAKILGYKIIHDITEDFTSIQENLTIKQKLNLILGRLIHRFAKLYTDGIIVVSNRLYLKYSNFDVPIIKLYNSVECNNRKTKKRRIDFFTFFYCGSFCIKDGVADLINAFIIVQKKFNNIKLVLTGKGVFPSFNECYSLIKSSSKIEYRGYLTEEEMFNELFNSNLACVTRINTQYANNGFPYKLAEYLSYGIPVLSTAVSDIPFLFDDKGNILLANPEDPESISLVMEYAIKNQDKIIQIGQHGKELCEKLFSIENIGKQLYDFIININ